MPLFCLLLRLKKKKTKETEAEAKAGSYDHVGELFNLFLESKRSKVKWLAT